MTVFTFSSRISRRTSTRFPLLSCLALQPTVTTTASQTSALTTRLSRSPSVSCAVTRYSLTLLIPT